MNNVNANVEAYINSLDTYIDVMKEETAKLSGMIAKLNDIIQEIEAEKERLIKEQNKSKFELAQNEKYYFINFLARGSCLVVQKDIYVAALGDRARVDQNNCFKTEKIAKEVLDKINLLLKLERLHDIYCPDYKAEDDGNDKYRIVFCDGMYQWEQDDYTIDFLSVYFPTEEIAQNVCDILNSEEQSNEIS